MSDPIDRIMGAVKLMEGPADEDNPHAESLKAMQGFIAAIHAEDPHSALEWLEHLTECLDAEEDGEKEYT
jgi:hypothetical protein